MILQTLGIQSQHHLSCAIGTFLAIGSYKKVDLTEKVVNDIVSECRKLNWGIHKDTKLKLLAKAKGELLVAEQTVTDKAPTKKSAIELDMAYMNCYQAKYSNSMRRGVEFKLTFPQFKTLLKTKHCYYTGRELVHEFGVQNTKPFNQVSLERLDSSKGYTKANTVAVCHGMNELRNKLDLETHSNKYELVDVLNMVSKLMEVK